MNKDYYKILGVSRDATQEEIKKAYRKLAHEHHPDKNNDSDEATFKEINEAYQVLGNPEKRSHYDRFGSAFEGGPSNWGGFSGGTPNWDINLDEIFGDFFSGFSGGGRAQQVQRGRNIVIDLELTLEESFRGAIKEVDLKKFVKCSRCKGDGAELGSKKIKCDNCGGSGEVRQTQKVMFGVFSQVQICPTCGGAGEYPEKPCKDCGGEGRIKDIEKISIPVPAGVRSGSAIKINGKGEEGPKGGVPGDLIVKIFVKEHPYLERKGSDLLSEIEISFPQAVFGDKLKVETIEDLTELEVPAGIQSGSELRLRGMGMPIGSGKRGDQIIKVNVKTPKKISRKAKKIIKDLEEEL